jgi:hypothetical protein
MGMFDEVICELPLPDGWKHPVFQTKDFEDPYLDKYVIRADGRLIRKKPWYECEIKADTDMNYHGLLRFYSYEGDPNDDTPIEYRWHEYEAKFTDGALQEILLVEPHSHR